MRMLHLRDNGVSSQHLVQIVDHRIFQNAVQVQGDQNEWKHYRETVPIYL